jgi:hypothetical protein
VDGTDRTLVPGVYNYEIPQGGGPFGGAPGDFSTYGSKFYLLPAQVLGKHEFECYGNAYSNDFDPYQITTAPVAGRFTGSTQAAIHLEQTCMYTEATSDACCAGRASCVASLLASGAVCARGTVGP